MALKTLAHPNSTATIKVEADQVPMYLSQGWQVAVTKMPAKKAAGRRPAKKVAAKKTPAQPTK